MTSIWESLAGLAAAESERNGKGGNKAIAHCQGKVPIFASMAPREICGARRERTAQWRHGPM